MGKSMTAAFAAIATLGAISASGADAATPSTVNRPTVTYVTPQQVGSPDPTKAAVTATMSGVDCTVKCQLVGISVWRGDIEERVLKTWTGGPGQTQTWRDDASIDDYFDDFFIVTRRYLGGGDWEDSDLVGVSAESVADSDMTVGAGWRRELDLTATETMILRSRTRGARVQVQPSEYDRRYGVIAERGPQAGVLKAVVNGATVLTVDLRAGRKLPRSVVGTVSVPVNGTLSFENATPSARAGAVVSLDSLLETENYDSNRQKPPQRARRHLGHSTTRLPDETIDLQPVEGTLPADGAGFDANVVAKVHGCPSGCEVVRQEPGEPDEVILSKTSPSSGSLKTLTVRQRVPYRWNYRYFTLRKGGTEIASTPAAARKYEQSNSAVVYSHGWTQDAMASATGGAIMRSATPGTGATLRAPGTFDGRKLAVVAARGRNNGVMKVYVDAVLAKTFDLYSPKWQPRQLIGTFEVPLKGRITIVNATPNSRPNKDVHVDAIIEIGDADDWYRTSEPTR